MLAGRTHFTIDGTVILMPQINAGNFRAIGMGRTERWHELPDVPTMAEQGFPDFTLDAWTGLVAPAGTPAPIIARLNAAINTGLGTPETKATLAVSVRSRRPARPRNLGRSSPTRAGAGANL